MTIMKKSYNSSRSLSCSAHLAGVWHPETLLAGFGVAAYGVAAVAAHCGGELNGVQLVVPLDAAEQCALHVEPMQIPLAA